MDVFWSPHANSLLDELAIRHSRMLVTTTDTFWN